MLGTINSLVRGEVIIHTYTSPESGLEANTHIVELPTQLLVIDTQYAVPFAAEAAAYAATLGKPITRVYVTHAHPDHFFGAAEFAAPVHALAATKSTIETNGEMILSNNRATAGDVLPDKVTAPTEVVIPGEIIIDGIRLELMEFTDGEAGDALVIALPDQDVLIAQDLVYNNLHLFIAEGHLDHWLAIVDELRQRGRTTHMSIAVPEESGPGLVEELHNANPQWKASYEGGRVHATGRDMDDAARIALAHPGAHDISVTASTLEDVFTELTA